MTIRDFISDGKQKLSAIYPQPEALVLIRMLLQEHFNLSFAKLVLNEDEQISSDDLVKLNSYLSRLETAEPLQYILGYTWFSELKIGVSNAVLIPRPETEELVDFILDDSYPESSNILDVCSGSGCISIALKSNFSKCNVVGCDVSFEAIIQAKKNAEELNFSIDWLWADVLDDNWNDLDKSNYSLIVSNPPYITHRESAKMSRNVLEYEPHLALFVENHEPLIFYHRIGTFAKKQLLPEGKLWFEINSKYADDISEFLENVGFIDVRIYADMSGKDRFIRATKP